MIQGYIPKTVNVFVCWIWENRDQLLALKKQTNQQTTTTKSKTKNNKQTKNPPKQIYQYMYYWWNIIIIKETFWHLWEMDLWKKNMAPWGNA